MAYTGFGNCLIADYLHAAKHGLVETLDPSENPAPDFAALVTAKAMDCYGCSQPVGTTPRQLKGGQWVADCAACGITNKLFQDAENPERFSVAGALIPIQRDKYA